MGLALIWKAHGSWKCSYKRGRGTKLNGAKAQQWKKEEKGPWKQGANNPIEGCKWRDPWNETCPVNKGAQKGFTREGAMKGQVPKKKMTNDPTKHWELGWKPTRP